MTKDEALNAVEKAIDIAYKKGQEIKINDFFSFAKYLNENFEYYDNSKAGDLYIDKINKIIYTQNDIHDEWLNNK